MAFTAELELEGKTYRVMKCEYGFTQEVDTQCKPVPKVKSGTIKMEIESRDDDTHLSWTANKSKKEEGTITFYKTDQSKFREIKFEAAYCIKYRESVVTRKNEPTIYKQEVEITAGRLTVAGIKHDNHWPE
jgi:hypothetical protein